MGWFRFSLDGDEERLRRQYMEASAKEERLLAITSMDQFSVLSKDAEDFIRDVLDEWISTEDIGCLAER